MVFSAPVADSLAFLLTAVMIFFELRKLHGAKA
jgi:hypothetical protein